MVGTLSADCTSSQVFFRNDHGPQSCPPPVWPHAPTPQHPPGGRAPRIHCGAPRRGCPDTPGLGDGCCPLGPAPPLSGGHSLVASSPAGAPGPPSHHASAFPPAADKPGVALWDTTPVPQEAPHDTTRHPAGTTAACPLDDTPTPAL